MKHLVQTGGEALSPMTVIARCTFSLSCQPSRVSLTLSHERTAVARFARSVTLHQLPVSITRSYASPRSFCSLARMTAVTRFADTTRWSRKSCVTRGNILCNSSVKIESIEDMSQGKLQTRTVARSGDCNEDCSLNWRATNQFESF